MTDERTPPAVAVDLARGLGLRVQDPVVLSERSSVMVRLAPGGPVARVAGLTAGVRDDLTYRTREVALARHLAAAGAPVIAPYEPAGPHERDGLIVTLWEEGADAPAPDGPELGETLRACHAALADYAGELPPLRALFEEAAEIADRGDLDAGERAVVRDGLDRVADEIDALGLPAQALHGDAGLGNVMAGAVWNDWEDGCRGPVVWDLACLVTTSRLLGLNRDRAEAALAAYGPAPGLDRLDLFVRARALQGAAWSAFALAEGAGSTPERKARRLAWLRSALG